MSEDGARSPKVEFKDANDAERAVDLAFGMMAVGRQNFSRCWAASATTMRGRIHLPDIVMEALKDNRASAYVETCEDEVRGNQFTRRNSRGGGAMAGIPAEDAMAEGASLRAPDTVSSLRHVLGPRCDDRPNVVFGRRDRSWTARRSTPFRTRGRAGLAPGLRSGRSLGYVPATVLEAGAKSVI